MVFARAWLSGGFYKEIVTGPLGFEPRFEAPEASVISKLYYGPAARANGPPSKGCPLNVG